VVTEAADTMRTQLVDFLLTVVNTVASITVLWSTIR
jgi:hypothetical protein